MEPDETTVVETAAAAAQDVILSRYERSELQDMDIVVSFEDGILEVEVDIEATRGNPEQVADDAALAARAAVDELFADTTADA